MTTKNLSRTSTLVGNQAMMAGLAKYQATHPSFSVGTETIKSSDVVTSLQADNAAINAVTPAKAAWQVAVQASKSQSARTRALTAKVKQALQVTFSGQVDALADFGLKPRKPRAPLTSEQKAAAAAKARATRAARKTMGTQQKKAVTGSVVGVTVTPVVAEPVAAATGSAQPAGSPAPVSPTRVA